MFAPAEPNRCYEVVRDALAVISVCLGYLILSCHACFAADITGTNFQ